MQIIFLQRRGVTTLPKYFIKPFIQQKIKQFLVFDPAG